MSLTQIQLLVFVMMQKKWEIGVNTSNDQVEHFSIELLQLIAKQRQFPSFISWLCSKSPSDVKMQPNKICCCDSSNLSPFGLFVEQMFQYYISCLLLVMCHFQLNKGA